MSNQNLIYSAFAAGLAEILTLPACTIKTRYQNTTSQSILQTSRMIYEREGLRGFYLASIPAVLLQALSISSKYTGYRYLEDMQLPYSTKFSNGLISGIIASLLTHPLDSIKIHQQMNHSFLSELKNVGPSLFFRGYTKAFSKVCIGSTLYFPLYDYTKQYIGDPFYAGICSATIATTIIHPVDFLKTRHIYNQQLFLGWNPISYYKGISINLLRIVPHFTIMMTTIDFLLKMQDKPL